MPVLIDSTKDKPMSMIGNLARISESKRIELHTKPELIEEFLYPDFVDEAPKEKKGILAKIFGNKPAPPVEVKEKKEGLPEEDQIDIDKAWHGLHFLFTGSNWEGPFPPGFLVSCGKEVGDVDVGYGPAKSFTPTEVKEISEFLENLDDSELKSRLDPKKMSEMEIYPSVWNDDTNIEDEWEYAKYSLDAMKQFIKEASERELALLVYIN